MRLLGGYVVRENDAAKCPAHGEMGCRVFSRIVSPKTEGFSSRSLVNGFTYAARVCRTNHLAFTVAVFNALSIEQHWDAAKL